MRLDDASRTLILDHVSDAVVAVDGAGRVTYWNQSAQRLYGIRAEDALGRPLSDLYEFEWANPSDEGTARAVLERSGFWRGEHVHVCRDGGRIHVRSAVLARKDDRGTITELLAIIRDMSEERRALLAAAESEARSRRVHETLQRSELRLDLVIESIFDYAIFTMDANRRIDSWNSGAERMFGYSAEEAIGQSGDVIFTAADRADGAPEQEMIEARDRGRALDERWHVRKDGSRLYVSGILSPLRDSTGQPAGFVKITRDLTERKAWEDRLQRAHDDLERRVVERTEHVEQLLRKLVNVQEDERRRIARDIHDHLGQQMTALRLNLASLRAAASRFPELQDFVDRTENLAATIDAEVDFLAWELRPGALEDLGLASALGDFVREWSRHYGIAAEFQAAELERVRLAARVETNLYRIAQEALNNVHKHARASHVSVVLERRDARIVLLIEDDGRGFDPASEDPQSLGAGMGLVGMRERATLVGGTLEVESAPGGGTTIFVEAPVDPDPDTAP